MNGQMLALIGEVPGRLPHARAWTWLLAAAVALGAFLRIYRFAAQVATTIALTFANYLAYRLWVFR